MSRKAIRILEGRSLLYDDVISYYKSKIMNEDYIIMNNIDEDRLRSLKNIRPFFSEYYLLEIHLTQVNSKVLNTLRKYSECDWIQMILMCTSKDYYDMLSVVSAVGFNGYNISEDYWVKYVIHRLKYNTNINLSTVYKEISGRFELTDIVIDEINKSCGNATVSSICKLIGKSDRMSLDMLWFNIILQNNKERGKVFKFIEDYRYGFDFIYKNLIKQYHDTIKHYKDFYDGLLNDMVLREYRKKNHESVWKITKYIEIFSNISFDELLLIGEMIECANVKSTSDMFVLIGRLYSRNTLGVMQ